jgi:hypothetical protein
MSTPTSNLNQPEPSEFPTTEGLVRVVRAFSRAEDAEQAGYVFGAEHAKLGDEAVVYSRGRYRAGIVTKIGRLNVTVTYTTRTAIQEAKDPRFRSKVPARTSKADKFAEVAIRPPRGASANPPVTEAPTRHGPDQASQAGEAPVTTSCDATGCRRPAANLLVWSLASGTTQATTRCHTDTALFTIPADSHDVHQLPLAAGTYDYLDDGSGTQIATCVHCGNDIYLYPALLGRPEPWRGHLYDETGRCGPGEDRTQIVVRHEPATTVAERDHALATAADVPLAVVSDQRLPHPNPYVCAECTTNRPTLLLTLSNREQVTVCRPHAVRYPK